MHYGGGTKMADLKHKKVSVMEAETDQLIRAPPDDGVNIRPTHTHTHTHTHTLPSWWSSREH